MTWPHIKTLHTIIISGAIRETVPVLRVRAWEAAMVKHGALSKSHVYQMLGSSDAKVRRAAFVLLEASNPRLRKDSDVFLEIVRFIWDAKPSYELYREFSKRHLYKTPRKRWVKSDRRNGISPLT